MTVLVVDSSFDLLRTLCTRLYAMDRGVLIGAYKPSDFASPDDLAATMFYLLGVDPHIEVTDSLNRPLAIAGGNPIMGILT